LNGDFVLYAWPLSYYSGKARAYLRYKAIPHVEKPARVWDFRTIKAKTGATVMPVVVTPEGEWLQDTAHIIDTLERRFPRAPVAPPTPCQKLAAAILEAWGDEFWVPSAMHYRWSFPQENFPMFQRQGGDFLLPFAPRFVKNVLIARAARLMQSFLPGLGVVPGQLKAIEAWTEATLDLLDRHFAAQPYLLGSRPSVGDFGLIGPLFAHLGRDPYPKRVLVEPRRHLAAWIARMQDSAQPHGGSFVPDDEVPATLDPLFRAIFAEFWPFLERTQREVTQALPSLPRGRGFSRSLGPVESPLGGGVFRRRATPFSLWKAQRVLDAYRGFGPADKAAADAWLARVGGERAMALKIEPRLKRMGLHVAPEQAS
jgi:glutathione S-transferase